MAKTSRGIHSGYPLQFPLTPCTPYHIVTEFRYQRLLLSTDVWTEKSICVQHTVSYLVHGEWSSKILNARLPYRWTICKGFSELPYQINYFKLIQFKNLIIERFLLNKLVTWFSLNCYWWKIKNTLKLNAFGG